MNTPNKHIIVGEGDRCLCATYRDYAQGPNGVVITETEIVCSKIIGACQRMRNHATNPTAPRPTDDEMLRVAQAVLSIAREVDAFPKSQNPDEPKRKVVVVGLPPTAHELSRWLDAAYHIFHPPN